MDIEYEVTRLQDDVAVFIKHTECACKPYAVCWKHIFMVDLQRIEHAKNGVPEVESLIK